MHFGIGGISKLVGNERVGELVDNLVGAIDRAGHSLGGIREDELGAERAKNRAAFRAHRLGHGQYALVALDRSHEGQCDSGVAAGRLDDNGLAGSDRALPLGVLDHGEANSILHAVGRIVALELSHDLRFDTGRDSVESDERSATDQCGDVVGDVHGTSVAR